MLQPGPDGTYGVPANASIIVSIPTANMGAIPKYAVIVADGQAYSLAMNADNTAFVGAFSAPKSGQFKTEVSVMFDFGLVSPPADTFQVQAVGQVLEKNLLGVNQVPVTEAKVTLYVLQSGNWVIWNGAPYGQANPTLTAADGVYLFVIPNGTYRAVVEKDGYLPETSKSFLIQKNVFGGKFEIVKIANNLEYAILSLEKFIRPPQLVDAVDNSEAPALIAISLINTFGSISFFNLLSYLRFLFTQPFLIFTRFRKKKWGVVYDAFTKQPIEFAVVRLIHYESRLVVQTRVADKQGRYIFTAKQGNYLIEISKQGYIFPSDYLKNQSQDAAFSDLYHGEVIGLKQEEIIAFNIPMDPLKAEESPKKILFKRFSNAFQHFLAVLGIVLSLAALIISPTYLSLVLLIVQTGFYLLFRKLAMPAKSEPWGLVLEARTRKPISGAVVRIFEQRFNKLLESIVTDASGKFGFLVDRNVFYITVEKAGYSKYTSEPLDLVTAKEKIVDFNIFLQTQSPTKPASLPISQSSSTPPVAPVENQIPADKPNATLLPE